MSLINSNLVLYAGLASPFIDCIVKQTDAYRPGLVDC